VPRRRVVNRHLFAGRLVDRVSTFLAAKHQVFDSHVGERSAHHHAIVAAS
jgi:hypothetical protein